jgi:hypothetical protein
MSENKTKATVESVAAFLESVPDERKRQDCEAVLGLMQEVTGFAPTMWGDSIVGFGQYHYKYASGREGDFFLTGFSPRKQNLTLYIQGGFEQYQPLLDNLGKFKLGKGCLYVKKLDDIDHETLRELVRQSVAYMQRLYPG